MIVAKKFLFENDFDDPMPVKEKAASAPVTNKPAPVSVPEPVVEPPTPTFSEEDLAAACDEARKQGEQTGHQRGLVEGQQRLEAQMAAALSTISAQLTLAVRAATEAPVEITVAATELAMAILRKMHPALSAKRGLDEVEGVLAGCLEQLKNEPRLVAYVPNQLLDPLNERVTAISAARGFEGRVVLIGDPDLADSDCRIEWADGGLERDTRRLWSDIEAALDRCLGQPEGMTEHDGAPA
jgi:flagellar assembly protein FliH